MTSRQLNLNKQSQSPKQRHDQRLSSPTARTASRKARRAARIRTKGRMASKMARLRPKPMQRHLTRAKSLGEARAKTRTGI